MREKFTSRKFIAALTGFIAALSTGNVPLAVSILATYVITEGVLDAKAMKRVAVVAGDVEQGIYSVDNAQMIEQDDDDEYEFDTTIRSSAPIGFRLQPVDRTPEHAQTMGVVRS